MTSRNEFKPSGSGCRELLNERKIVSELSRMLNVVRTDYKEKSQVKNARNLERNSNSASAVILPKRKKEAKKGGVDAMTARRDRKRRNSSNKHGGSVWILLKGGFNASNVPPENKSWRIGDDSVTVTEYRAYKRLELELHLRERRLLDAEAYVDSAWREAEIGGLLNSSSVNGTNESIRKRVPSQDGEVYLQEQYDVAKSLLDHAPVGQAMKDLAQNRGTSALLPVVRSSLSPKLTSLLKKYMSKNESRWIKLLEGENRIRLGLAEANKNTEVSVVKEADLLDQLLASWLHITEELGSTNAVKDDIKPTKCIIRLRNSQKDKHSAILSEPKAINYFTSHILEVIRKEFYNSSVLPRGGKEKIDEPMTVRRTHNDKTKKRQIQPQKENTKRGRNRKK